MVAVGIIVTWLVGDFTYSQVVQGKYESWNAGIVRDSNGIREGCAAFTLGEGTTALLFIHGFGDAPAVWKEMAPALADRGYTCRAMRIPGFGQELAAMRESTHEQWVAAARAELLELSKTHERVFIVGHSTGCAVGVNLLANSPEAASGLVAMGPLMSVNNSRSPILSSESWFKVLNRLFVFTDLVASAFKPQIFDESKRPLLVDRFVPIEIFREMFALIGKNRKLHKNFKAPLMMVLSEQDAVVDNEAAREFYENCSAEHKQIAESAKAGHVLPLDFGWDEHVEAIDVFVQSIK
jgi:carboxylesterase